ncbi:MAG: hypothetical protein NTW67_04245 [Candidatus Woesearchaeota archaeon]|nr:hypothetical protein [Candidatus Woesearchaeota archaeon]
MTFINVQNFEDYSPDLLSGKVKTEHVILKLKDLSVTETGLNFVVEHNGSVYFVKQTPFAESLSKFGVNCEPIDLSLSGFGKHYPIDVLVNLCASRFDGDVKLYVNKAGIGVAIALLNADADPVTYEEAYGLFERLKKDKICLSSFNGDETRVPIYNRSCKLKIPPEISIESTLRSMLASEESEFYGFIADRLITARYTAASVRECIEAGDAIAAVDSSYNFRQAGKIGKKLEGMLGDIPRKKIDRCSLAQWAKVKSPMNRLQLFNRMIDTIANETYRNHLTNKTHETMFYDCVGQWLFTPGHFEECRKPVSGSQPALPPDDDDIISWFGNANRPRGIYDTKEF